MHALIEEKYHKNCQRSIKATNRESFTTVDDLLLSTTGTLLRNTGGLYPCPFQPMNISALLVVPCLWSGVSFRWKRRGPKAFLGASPSGFLFLLLPWVEMVMRPIELQSNETRKSPSVVLPFMNLKHSLWRSKEG